ncbi:hypothetical protein OpiT1DRAFT_02038 [Opitutaceae bacterium TAV1]|nr:hypothetical protein OpiT1DRAFT_02038 [Opitutaceae bacterium TAV1]
MQTIGERLEEARKRKGISIREAAEATKIRSDYLHKFESNQFDIRLPDIYLHGFLRNYANFLKLPGDRILADFHALGFGEARSAKALNREVYGRMDLSVSSEKPPADTSPVSPAPVAANPSPEAPAHKPQATPPPTVRTFSIGSSIAGLNLNRALILKTGTLITASIILLVLVVWAGVKIFGGGSKTPSAPPAAASSGMTPVDEGPLYIVLTGPTNLKIVRQRDGAVLYDRRNVQPAGTRVQVPREPVLVSASAAQNLRIETSRGKAFNHPDSGQRDNLLLPLDDPQLR